MPETMTKARLMGLVDAGRAEWDRLLADTPRDWMTQPDVVGDWSVKDIVAHVAFWERVSAGRVGSLVSGHPPSDADLYGADITDEIKALDIDPFNRWQYERDRDRPLDEVLMDEQQSFRRLYTYLRAAREDDLLTAGRFDWASESAPWRNVEGNTYDHWAEHSASIRAWLDRRRA